MQLFDVVGWQPATVKGLGCSYLRLSIGARLATYSSKRARMQLFDAVGWQPTALKGLG